MWNIPEDETSSVRWDTFIDESGESRILRTQYQNSKYADLLLNRDNNGNGFIDEDEVRWYLPSINQLVDLWVGEPGIDIQTRLFKGTMTYSDKADRIEEFYASSTIKKRSYGKDQPWVLWSSQGATGQNNSGGKSHRTCGVRNLGISLKNKDEMPTDFVLFDSDQKILYLKYLNDKSIRNYYLVEDHELPLHYERSHDCKPYLKFKLTNNFYWGGTWTQTNAEADTETKNGKV